MDVGVSSPAKSILEKPLKLLTEDDLSQLTREDCRNFLKQKGMRRPSWIKSQAIQQVLSLKALFEPGDDSGAGIIRKILVSQTPNTPPKSQVTIEPSNELEAHGLCHRRDSPRSAEYSGGSCHFVADKDSCKTTVSPRSSAETSALVEQMTIFYCGKVNVYDGVPPEKARSIMHFAANPIDLPENGIFASSGMISKPMSKEKMVELPRIGLAKANSSRDSDMEGQANRKVSLQRYREKRKDRKFSKAKKCPGVASSSLEMFLNRQPRMNAAYSQNLGCTGSPLQSESPEISTKSQNLTVDLNSEGIYIEENHRKMDLDDFPQNSHRCWSPDI